MSESTLRQMQAAFWQNMHRQGDVATQQMFGSENGFAAEERLAIYANMYEARLLEALRADFSQVETYLGSAQFETAAMAYIRRHPPRHYSVSALGANFSRFLAHIGTGVAADLAALAWARWEAWVAVDVPPVSVQQLAQHASPPEACLKFAPTLRIVRARCDVAAHWRAAAEGTTIATTAAHAVTTVAVWRSKHEVCHTTLSPDEAQALRWARAGAPLARVCEAFGGPDPIAAAWLAVGGWFADGWVTDLRQGCC